MKSDIQIARETRLKRIKDVAEGIGIPRDEVINFGRHMAKIPVELINMEKVDQSNLILVTAITPTKAGVGKTTVSIGLALGLNKIGKNAIVALREPSLGPVFGMKGGAAGGGYAQVLPMENINLHFTGDFHAVTTAHNTIAALLENYNFRVQGTGDALKQILWKRVLDVNDRSLRYIVTGLGPGNGIPQEAGFDITAASELMAILCLSEDEDDLRRRIENILLGYKQNGEPFTVKDLGVAGAITVLMKDAIHPNLVQTTENTPAFIHGGPFANIAHGCNSVIATKMAMTFGDYVITEAGFGADLGAEKFFNIKCRKSGLRPKLSVIVVTAQGLKMHGGTPEKDIKAPDLNGLQKGLGNLEKHLSNLASFGQSVVVAFNKYAFDTEEEIDAVRKFCEDRGVSFAVNEAFTKGGDGAIELAEKVVEAIEKRPSGELKFTYSDKDDIETKINKIAKHIYGAQDVVLSETAIKKLKMIQNTDLEKMPVCIAKTQYSFSADPNWYGVAKDFRLKINDLVINQGSEFIVAIAGQMMRMPGLPADPQAKRIDIVNGEIEGLS
ncbi:MAG TPA: formate--tetrahydrofolate ligase [Fermentimonas caenicola]|jgi:formate--tetrahydrofolate ligase|uniref:formate--tetrahydrofolate ligase n=1 Tax=Lascolabacillus sp. TaxID=1924068 RepID=UPI001213822E|nr:formate--tetrahydrofolate ligase [Lascolabacillus sp.]MBP6175536.1 formate--tetrahydrofolate ligase [Fermentimonas sp.]TAH61751.1 MAG: formate--tetrahydrofolate ligase [Fermentimonas caenicola]MBP6197270.1 formate--tetrahydrofolate ligase [Fermentimonas sp.]MBP7104325.1 formate--tetrahydrofolate ligase [Fermentimonas sp.]MCK9500656.1 formate--tetrahydrofolate ligase [Lascolabacillus sp.]